MQPPDVDARRALLCDNDAPMTHATSHDAPLRRADRSRHPAGPPLRFTWRRVTRLVARAQGPERIAPEWWHLAEGAAPRDYYVIEDAQGRRYWLYREGLYGEAGGPLPKWFVHGLSS